MHLLFKPCWVGERIRHQAFSAGYGILSITSSYRKEAKIRTLSEIAVALDACLPAGGGKGEAKGPPLRVA
jgi:hypothetical protein